MACVMSELRTPLTRKLSCREGEPREVESESGWPLHRCLVDQGAPVTYRKDDQDSLGSMNRAPPVKGGDT